MISGGDIIRPVVQARVAYQHLTLSAVQLLLLPDFADNQGRAGSLESQVTATSLSLAYAARPTRLGTS